MNQLNRSNVNDELNFDDLNLENITNNGGALDEESNIEKQEIIERRKNVREPKQEPQGKLYYLLKIDYLGKKIFETNIGRIIFTLLVLLSFSILFWEFSARLDLLDKNVSRNNENNRLTTELESLRSQWSEAELQKIEQNIKKAEAKIFNSVPSLAEWLNSKNSSAVELGFNLKYTIGSASNVDVDGTYSMPVSFDLNANKNNKNTYAKSLAFIRSIIDENRRLEIVSTEFSAENQGVNRFSLLINLWVKDPNGIITIKETNGSSESDEFIQ